MTVLEFTDTLLYDQEKFKEQVEKYKFWPEIISHLGKSKKVIYNIPCTVPEQVLEVIEFLELIDGNGWETIYEVDNYFSYSRVNFSIERINI